MKQFALLFLLLSFSIASQAQSWKAFSARDTLNYTHSLNELPVPDYCMRIVSTQTIGNDTIFILNTITRIVSENVALTSQPAFLQKKFQTYADGLTVFSDTATYNLYPSAAPGQSWVFNPGRQITATVLDVKEMNLFGLSDSLKTILLSTGDTLQISQNWGISRFPDFLQEGEYYQLTGIDNKRLGSYLPNKRDFVLNNEVNDKFYYRITSIYSSPYSTGTRKYYYHNEYLITGKSVTDTGVDYTALNVGYSVYLPPYNGEPVVQPMSASTKHFIFDFSYDAMYDGYPNEFFFDEGQYDPRYHIIQAGIQATSGIRIKYTNNKPYNIYRNDSLIFESWDNWTGTQNPVLQRKYVIIPGVPFKITPNITYVDWVDYNNVYGDLLAWRNQYGSAGNWMANSYSNEYWPIINEADTLTYAVQTEGETQLQSIWVKEKTAIGSDVTIHLNTNLIPLPDNRYLMNQAWNFGTGIKEFENQKYLLKMEDEDNPWNNNYFYPAATEGFSWISDPNGSKTVYVKDIQYSQLYGLPDNIKIFVASDGSILRLSRRWGILADSLFLNKTSVATLSDPGNAANNPVPFIHKIADGMQVGDVFQTKTGTKEEGIDGRFKITQATNRQFEIKEKIKTDSVVSYVVQGAFWDEPTDGNIHFFPYRDTLKYNLYVPDEKINRGLSRMLYSLHPDTIKSTYDNKTYIHVAEAYWNDTLQREGCRLVPYLYDLVDNDTLNLATAGPGDLVTTHCHYLEGLPLLEYRDLKAATATTPSRIDFHELTAWATELDSYGFLLVYPSGINAYQGFLNLRVHPNPFINNLIVEIDPNKQIERLELWNRQGALVMLMESKDNKLVINTAQLPSGIYTVRVYAGLNYQSYKLIKL